MRLWLLSAIGTLLFLFLRVHGSQAEAPFQLQGESEQLYLVSDELEGEAIITINGAEKEVSFSQKRAPLNLNVNQSGALFLFSSGEQYQLYHIAKKEREFRIRHIPLWTSVLPPLIAILLALIFKEVVLSLFVGIFTGAFIASGMRIESFYYLVQSLLDVISKYIIGALNDTGHLSIIIFSTLIGGMVAIISRNGGMTGVVNRLSSIARTPQTAQFTTWLLGVAIFFDDYANTLIVGNTMRPVTDRFRISREKLAYIVDSTAAPVAAVAFITTWIGAELSYIDDGIQVLDNFDSGLTPYAIFINSLRYSFYPFLTLMFILLLIYTKRDYGKMHTAEKRARKTGQVAPKVASEAVGEDAEDLSPIESAPLRAYNAVIPVLTVILVTIFGLIATGMATTSQELRDLGIALPGERWAGVWANLDATLAGESATFSRKLGKLIGNADSYVALLWASLSGVLVAVAFTVGGRIMRIGDCMSTMVTGFKTMVPALVILTLAWSLAATTEELHTAVYLTTALQDSLNPYLMPVIVFILAAFIAFSTGSSWSTMAILYPIGIPTTWAICMAQNLDPAISMEILLNVISVTLGASVLGDHCSPISDTTILSSLASNCNHIDHVRTQLPYALTVGIVAIICGGVSTLLGGGWGISLMLVAISLVVLYLVIIQIGKPTS